MKRINISSGTKWENEVGYSRIVKTGNHIEVCGTTAFDKDKLIGPGDAAEQSDFIFKKMSEYLEQVDSSLTEITLVRVYLKNISDFGKVSEVFSKYFKTIRPVFTVLSINEFVHPDILVEIEASAFSEKTN